MSDKNNAWPESDQSISPGTLAWIETALGSSVAKAEALVGGRSSEVHRCVLEDQSSVVVRHISDTQWLSREPDLISREAEALTLLELADISTPSLVAADELSSRLAMTFEPGAMLMGADELGERIADIARLAANIRNVQLPPATGLPLWKPWVPDSPVPPPWGDNALWADAIDAYESSPPIFLEGDSLLHRDLHPGNILWGDDGVHTVVDWVNACVGHPHAELGHCRWNLSCLIDDEAPKAFLRSYLEITGDDSYDTWWDLSCALSFLPGPIDPIGWNQSGRPDLTPARVVAATETFIKAALKHR